MKGKLAFDIDTPDKSCSDTIEVILLWGNYDNVEFLHQGFKSLDDAVEYAISCELILESLLNEEQLEPHLPEYDMVYTDLEKFKVVFQSIDKLGKISWKLNPDIEEVGSVYDSEFISTHLQKRQESIVGDISQCTKQLFGSIFKPFF